MHRTVLNSVGFAVLALTAACGGAQFKATPNQPAQKPLKLGIKPEIVESADGLPQPVLVVGVLAETTKSGEEDRKSVEKDFKLLAAGKGCNAIVGLTMEAEEQHAQQKVYHKGADGKVSISNEDVTTQTYHWHADCVRSAAADSAAPVKGSAVAPGPAPEPAVVSGDTDPAVQELLKQLAPFETAYLRNWKEKLHGSTVDPLDALGATLELMAQVDKFWKITVPQEWLGCRADPRSDACVNHSKLLKSFHKADELRRDIERLDRSPAALAWLRRNGARVAAYLDTYVPTETSDSAMRATPLWAERLGH